MFRRSKLQKFSLCTVGLYIPANQLWAVTGDAGANIFITLPELKPRQSSNYNSIQ